MYADGVHSLATYHARLHASAAAAAAVLSAWNQHVTTGTLKTLMYADGIHSLAVYHARLHASAAAAAVIPNG